MVNAITGAEHGEHFWMECQRYYKGKITPIQLYDRSEQLPDSLVILGSRLVLVGER